MISTRSIHTAEQRARVTAVYPVDGKVNAQRIVQLIQQLDEPLFLITKQKHIIVNEQINGQERPISLMCSILSSCT